MDYRKSKLVPVLGYLYLIIPVLIFCFGWLKWYFALFVGLAFLVCGVFIYRRINPIDLVLPKDKRTLILFSIAIVTIVLLMILSGIGNNSAQTDDMYWRNTIFTELVKEPWPASMTGMVGGEEKTIYLVYYIGFYMVPALFGKVFGIPFGFASITIWAVIGLTIIYLLICSYVKKVTYWPLIVFLFFSGFDYLDRMIFLPNVFKELYEFRNYVNAYFYHLEWIYGGVNPYSIPSHITQLFWTFNQAIPMFVLLSLVFLGHQEKDIVFLTSTIVLSSTLSCFGVAAIIIFLFFMRKDDGDVQYRFIHSFDELKHNFLKYVLNPSVLLAIPFTLFTGLYAASNTNVNGGTDERGLWLQNPFDSWDHMLVFLVFIFFEIIIVFLYVFKYYKKNPLLYLSLLGVIVPMHIRLNGSVDIMLKVSTPFLFIFSLMTIFSLKEDYHSKKKLRLGYGTFIVAGGSITGLFEIIRLGLISLEMYGGRHMIFFALSMDLLIIISVIATILTCFYIANNQKKSIKNISVILLPFLCLSLSSLLLSLIINYGLQGRWTGSCDAWNEIYLASNFSGNPDSLFFKIFAH